MARARKPSNLDAQLEQWAAAIVDDPASFKGRWKQSFFPDAREVRLDLGCGKGAFLARSAKANPEVLYIGMDIDSTCVARCAKKAILEELPNMVVARADAACLLEFFEPGELSLIHLNFNAPYPPKKMAARRLTHIDHLSRYRTILGETGRIELRTDNMPYWKWSLEELRIAGYHIDWRCEDLHGAMRELAEKRARVEVARSEDRKQAKTEASSQPFNEPSAEAKLQLGEAALTIHHENFVRSEYDEKLVEKGAVVYSLIAHPGPAPAEMEQTTKLGLVDYLPEDLDTLEHIPYGMEDTIFNMRNRKKNAREAQARRAWWERKYKSKRSTAAKGSKSGTKGVSCNKHENASAPRANANVSPTDNK
ncbi:MAG: tRNA (guanosine(46)-N7)-methyltransferase TrmB [Coriobacteriia bacterium]|nr:tRNA (guanosine(46)-N7)-methyltransferase TrmB [Coriobacteriia bacterium]